jgi:phosphopantothenoylcysteine decarboxylase/phosphopantothenate--cysteine ligase
MHKEVTARAAASDVLIMSAAVADYRAAHPSEKKLKRTGDALTIELLPNPDILASVSKARGEAKKPLIVGFALETDKLMQSAKEKLIRKGCDLLVANLADESIGLDASIAYVLDKTGVIDEPGRLPKAELADRILDQVLNPT